MKARLTVVEATGCRFAEEVRSALGGEESLGRPTSNLRLKIWPLHSKVAPFQAPLQYRPFRTPAKTPVC